MMTPDHWRMPGDVTESFKVGFGDGGRRFLGRGSIRVGGKGGFIDFQSEIVE